MTSRGAVRYPRAKRKAVSPAEEWARQAAEAKRRALEDVFESQARAFRLPIAEREYRFHEGRAWRFDFAFVEFRIAVEVEGGTWSGGRHTRGAGYEADTAKYNAAALDGWTVLRFTSTQVKRGEAIRTVADALTKASGRRA